MEFEKDYEDEWSIKEIIDKSFKTDEFIFNNPDLKSNEFTIDCNHSKNYLSLKLQTTDKKGIIAYIMQVMDKHNIDVEDIKISVQKNIVRDILIINKNSGFCEKKDLILGEFK
jgi:[protein-PII] uridylyltransferase